MDKNKSTPFQLKATLSPVTVMKLHSCDLTTIQNQLQSTERLAPNYFHLSPVVLDVQLLERPLKALPLKKVCNLLIKHQLIPAGIQGLNPEENEFAIQLKLAVWKNTNTSENKEKEELKNQVSEGTKNQASEETKDQANKDDIPAKTQEKSTTSSGTLIDFHARQIITKPTRSGMRHYAKNGDLILLAPVSSGAECIADGNIHCYAPVRGRLLAGANGNQDARIFCHNLESELIAIAGYYLTYDECPENRSGFFEIYLDDNHLIINNYAAVRSTVSD